MIFPTFKRKIITDFRARRKAGTECVGSWRPLLALSRLCSTCIDLAEAGSLKDAGEMGGKKNKLKSFKIFFVYLEIKYFLEMFSFSESHVIKKASLFLKLLVSAIYDINSLMSSSKVSLF